MKESKGEGHVCWGMNKRLVGEGMEAEGGNGGGGQGKNVKLAELWREKSEG